MTELIDDLRALIDGASDIVIFTGAGISTESGIPDFRSPNGIWSKQQPIEFQDFVADEEMRRETWRRKIIIDKEMSVAKPNRGHRAVAELVTRGQCATVITQNIDGLHQDSGIDDENIVELHGNGTYAACLDCRKRFALGPIFENFERDETLPICDACGGMVKTATISFGQSMPVVAMKRAEQATLGADLFLVLGSSLVVYPAAAFPIIVKQNGANLAIVNRDPTDHDRIADLVVNDEIGSTLGAAVGVD